MREKTICVTHYSLSETQIQATFHIVHFDPHRPPGTSPKFHPAKYAGQANMEFGGGVLSLTLTKKKICSRFIVMMNTQSAVTVQNDE